jgi:hypothetical protein
MRKVSGHLGLLIIIGSLTLSTVWAAAALELPARGIEKTEVESRFGAPLAIEGPVGQPPITKWIYREFAVVFEYDHVVHSYKREPAIEQLPVTDRPAASGDSLNMPQPAEPAAAP